MSQLLNLTALLVDDYVKAIGFFVDDLGFELREDVASMDGTVGGGCAAQLAEWTVAGAGRR